MAKAKRIEVLDCDGDAAAMASEVLTVRFDEMIEFHRSAIAPDQVDGVHDMRVASRRFRSVLRDFGPLFDKKALRSLKVNIKEIADALGKVRNEDVAIEALRSLCGKAPDDSMALAIDRIIESRNSARSKAHAVLRSRVHSDRLSSLRFELDELLDTAISEDNETTRFRSFGVSAIKRALDKFLERSERIYHPFDDKSLHKFRLSAKRLRYALELFDECWGGDLKRFAKYVSKLQSRLGEVHDSSEWIDFISKNIGADHGIDSRAASWLISEFVKIRTDEYLKALELWSAWLAADHAGSLRRTIAK